MQTTKIIIIYEGSTKNNGCPNSTGVPSSTNTFTILPETSASISLNNFIASTIQTTLFSVIISPTSTKGGLSGEGFLYNVPMIGETISTYFEVSSPVLFSGTSSFDSVVGAIGAGAVAIC